MPFNPKKNPKVFSATSHDFIELCDATLVSNDGATSFPVHKLVLALRSEYFCTLFFQKQWHKAEEEDQSVFPLDFDSKVVQAIETFCYKDDCDDDFSNYVGKLKWISNDKHPDLSRRQRLDKIMTQDQAVSNACYLVSLAVAADYLMLKGLTRLLWKVAYDIMCNHLPELIPAIYSEATKHSSKELHQLAWYCCYLVSVPGKELQNMEGHVTESSLLEPFDLTDPKVDCYGVILVMGCSDGSINGTYHGSEAYVDYQWGSCTEGIVFKKANGEDKGALQ